MFVFKQTIKNDNVGSSPHPKIHILSFSAERNDRYILRTKYTETPKWETVFSKTGARKNLTTSWGKSSVQRGESSDWSPKDDTWGGISIGDFMSFFFICFTLFLFSFNR